MIIVDLTVDELVVYNYNYMETHMVSCRCSTLSVECNTYMRIVLCIGMHGHKSDKDETNQLLFIDQM